MIVIISLVVSIISLVVSVSSMLVNIVLKQYEVKLYDYLSKVNMSQTFQDIHKGTHIIIPIVRYLIIKNYKENIILPITTFDTQNLDEYSWYLNIKKTTSN